MSDKINVARIKKYGETFEITINPDKALEYKKGKIDNISEVLLAEKIFSDAKKGMVVSDNELDHAFKTTDIEKVAEIILKEGEIQVTAEHRAEERERRKRKLITLIHQQAIDPTTNIPHPAARIEAALEQAKVHLDDHKSVEDQFDAIVSMLRPIIPLKIEQKVLSFTIPAHYTGKAYNTVKSKGKILAENWNHDGSWSVKAELSAGLVPEFIDALNAVTHGEVVVEIE